MLFRQIVAWRDTKKSFEGSGKAGLILVGTTQSHIEYRQFGLGIEQITGFLHTDFGDVALWRFACDGRKAPAEL